MTKADLGIKRLCPNCGAKYYDLHHRPIVCPRCGTTFETTAVKARPQPAAKPAVVIEEPVAVAEEAEIVSLEEADEEVADSGKVKSAPKGEGDDVADADEAEEIEADDDTFLEPQEDEDEDVGDIIGDVDSDER